MNYYNYHIFFCLNERAPGLECCMAFGALPLFNYMKNRIKALGLSGPGKTRINRAGCMDRCSQGPVIVIYPDSVWYRPKTEADVDEIIVSHLQNGQIVTRLQLLDT